MFFTSLKKINVRNYVSLNLSFLLLFKKALAVVLFFTPFFVEKVIFVYNPSDFPQPRPTRGRMRIHCLENVDKALQFLKEQRVHLENVGSHDIVDGNHRLTLGLMWTIILRFQVNINT